MRDIKFRAWDKKNKMMRTVDELLNLWTVNDHGGEAKTTPSITVVNQSYRGDDLQMVVGKDCELMQYTGLKDKNGKEIYEGDVVSYQTSMGFDASETYEEVEEVKYKSGAFTPVYLSKRGFHDYNDKPVIVKDLEVIGNIYEHPKLVKEAK